MIRNLLTLTLLLAATTVAQTSFSESQPYKPKAKSKASTTPSAATSRDFVIPFSVLDKNGMPVTDLTRDQVMVLVDRVEAEVTAFETPRELPNIVLLLDMSPSTALRVEKIKEQARDFVNALPAGARVLVAQFNSTLNIPTQLTEDRNEILEGIKKAQFGDGTSLYSTIETMAEKVLPLVPGKKVVVIFSDGVDTTSKKGGEARSLRALEKSAVPFYAVLHDTSTDRKPGASLGNRGILGNHWPLPPGLIGQGTRGSSREEYERGREYLDDLGLATGGRVLNGEKFDEAIKSFVVELSSIYYVTISVPRNGSLASRPVRVRINRRDLNVMAKGSFVE